MPVTPGVSIAIALVLVIAGFAVYSLAWLMWQRRKGIILDRKHAAAEAALAASIERTKQIEEAQAYMAAQAYADSVGRCEYPHCPCSRPCGPAAMARADASLPRDLST